jgi:hypothetical protein
MPTSVMVANIAGIAMILLFSEPACAVQQSQLPSNVAQAQEPGSIDFLLRPVRDGQADVTAIAVRSVINAAPLAAGERLSLTAPIVYAGAAGIADRVHDLIVADRAGIVPLSVSNDAAVPGGFPYFRHWRATRDVQFPVVVTYRALVDPISTRRGPPFAIRATGGGVTGGGMSFLVIPENVATGRANVRWDLGDVGAGSLAASSFGDGDFTLTGAASALWQGWYMAGPAGRFPETGDVNGFSATWLGTPPWDPRLEMPQTARIYSYLGEVFGANPPPRYRVFVRVTETPPFGGGTALTNSFMLSRGPATPGDDEKAPQSTFFHEMIHGFVGGIEGPQGVTSWFSEGLTSYYTSELQRRGGFTSIDDYGRDINEVAREYYTSPARNWSADQIVKVGFSDNDIRHLPYRRGQLYFADLDARIRAASGGQRTLDTVMREIFERRDKGWRFDHAAWIEVVTKELGASAREEFESAILSGQRTLVPASNAFGPCFERQPTTYTVGGKSVEGYRWERVPTVPGARCITR